MNSKTPMYSRTLHAYEYPQVNARPSWSPEINALQCSENCTKIEMASAQPENHHLVCQTWKNKMQNLN